MGGASALPKTHAASSSFRLTSGSFFDSAYATRVRRCARYARCRPNWSSASRCFFVVWHLLFPWTDLAFTLAFVPGVILAVAYSSNLLVAPFAVTLLPAALLMNMAIFFVMRSMFHAHGLKIRRNVGGFVVYTFGYSLLLQPARIAGYLLGLLKPRATKKA